MKKNKFFSSLLATILLISTFGSIASASASASNSIGTSQELIKVSADNNEQNMVNNIMKGYGEIKNLETGEKLDLKVESSKTEVVNDEINSLTSKNVTDTSTQYKTEAVATANVTGTTSGNQSDSSLSMTVYITLYYTTYPKNGFNYVGIDKVSYRFEKSDSSVTVSNKQVFVGQIGIAYSNGAGITGQKTTRNALNSETILVNAWGWDPVLKDGLGYACGTKITATLQRGTGSNWSFSFNLPV